MRWLMRLFRKRKLEAQLDTELRFHLEQRTADLIVSGVEPAEARRRAMIEFGGIESAKEECREARGTYFLESVLQDIRYVLRTLRKSPGFTSIVILTLALGLGANIAIFSAVDAILLRPLPYRNPGRLAFIMESNPESAFGEAEASLPNLNDWRASSKTIQQFAAFTWKDYFLTGGREPKLVWGLNVSPNFFSTLGVQPALGSTFSARKDQSGSNVVVISNALYQKRFRSNPNVVGRRLVLNDKLYTIIGVLPPDFRFPPRDIIPGMDPQIFAPLVATAEEAARRDVRVFEVIARLEPGVSVPKARAELSGIAISLASQYPATNHGWGIKLTPVKESATGGMRIPLLILACAVGLVLLLACANAANMLLAKNVSRRQELALRAALGASPSRIMRQIFTESLLLALVATALGSIAAAWTFKVIVLSFPTNFPRVAGVRMDGTVMLVSLLLAAITALLFGSLPAIRASRCDLENGLRSGAGRLSARSLFGPSNALVAFQVAVSMMLLIGAGLLIHSMVRLLSTDSGFHSGGVVTARLELPPYRYRTRESVEAFHRSVLDGIRAMPGVESAAIVMTLPLSGRSTVMNVEPEAARSGGSARLTHVEYNAVTEGYFRTMRVALLRGRPFTRADEQSASLVAIVNEAMAQHFWPGENPIGRYFRFGSSSWTPWLRVVGEVKNEKYWSLTDGGKPEFYLPSAEASRFGATYLMRILSFLVIRSALPTRVMTADIRKAVWNVDPDEPVAEVKSMDRLVSDSIARRRFATLLLGVLAGLAASLALTGLYAVLAFSVSRRTHEIGIRMALGSQPKQIFSIVVGRGVLLAGTGIIVGIAGALALTRLLRGMLYGITPLDPTTFVLVPLVLAAVAFAACLIPARRAARVDPVVALRQE